MWGWEFVNVSALLVMWFAVIFTNWKVMGSNPGCYNVVFSEQSILKATVQVLVQHRVEKMWGGGGMTFERLV